MAEETKESSGGEKDFSLINDILVEGIFKGTIESSDSYHLSEIGNKVMSQFLNLFDKVEVDRIIQKILQDTDITQKILQDDFLQTFVVSMNKDGFKGYNFYNKLHEPSNLDHIINLVDQYNMRFQLFFCHLSIIAKEKAKEYHLLTQEEETLTYLLSR